MSLPFTVVDAFTNKPFGGNPAAVIVLPSDHTYPDSVLQSIALEFNLSETAFVTVDQRPIKDTGDGYVSLGLRWFTPTDEVKICGHATVASAMVLFSDNELVPEGIDEIRFSTLSGVLITRRVPDSPRIELEFPAGIIVPAGEATALQVTEMVRRATGVPDLAIKFVGVSRMSPYEPYLLVEIDSNVNLSSLKVNPNLLGSKQPARPITVITNEADTGFNVRVFASAIGIPEDPVTGSASSFAAKYWATRASVGAGQVVKVRQVSARGGDLDVIWEEQSNTAKIRGEARVASRGEIYL